MKAKELYETVKRCGKEVRDEFLENKYLWRPFLVLFVLYSIGISAIILAGVFYADDIARTNHGYAGWNGFSRYLSTILSHGLHADNYLTNIAPLAQIIAVVILAFASLVLICVICGKEVFHESPKKWWWYLVAVLPLGLSPYMLECLSYQYDAPYMAISVLFAILPVLFRKEKWWIYGLAIFISMMVVCTTYQAAVGIFPMVVIIVAMMQWNKDRKDGKEILKFVAFSAILCIVSLLIFDKVLMKPRDAYVSNSLPGIETFFTDFVAHMKQYIELVLSDFKILWKILIVMMMVIFVGQYTYNSKRNKILALIIGTIGVLLIGVFSFAIYAVLEGPLYAPRAMYPFGAFLAIIGIYIVMTKVKVLKLPVFVLSWCFFVFAFTYGNALKVQDAYRNEIIDLVIGDLNDMPVMMSEETKNVQVSGSLGFAPAILHMPQDYQILNRLLMPTYSEYVPWMANRITYQSGFGNLMFNETVDLKEMDLPVLKETVFYRIRGDEKNILVEFKDERKFDVIF